MDDRALVRVAADNFEGSLRTAQVYVQLARDRVLLEAAKTQSSAHFSIDRALRDLVKPKDTRPLLNYAPGVVRDSPALPPDEEAEARIGDADYVLRSVASELSGALDPGLALRPEEAAEVLRRAKDGDRLAGDLRGGVAWLLRVLDEAE